VFARELSADLASLVKQLDKVVSDNQGKKMAGFVVLLSEDSAANEKKLQAFAEKHNIKHMPLTIFAGATGPRGYNLAREADVTVHLYVNRAIKANHAFAKGHMTAAAIKQVVADTSKILE